MGDFLFVVTIPSGVRLQRSGAVQEVNETIDYGIASNTQKDRADLGPTAFEVTKNAQHMYDHRDSDRSGADGRFSVMEVGDRLESDPADSTTRKDDGKDYDSEVSRKNATWQTEASRHSQTPVARQRELEHLRSKGVHQVEAQMQGLFTPGSDPPADTNEENEPRHRSSTQILSDHAKKINTRKGVSKNDTQGSDKPDPDNNDMINVDVSELLADLLENDLALIPIWMKGMKGKRLMVQFPCEASKVELVIARLLGIGVGGDYGTVQVLPIELSRPVPDIDVNLDDQKTKFMESVRSRLVMEKVLAQVEAGAAMTFDYLSLVVIAAMVAGMGLATNSVVAVVASMLISPIMGPILAFTFGTMILDWKMVLHGLKMELLSLLMCAGVGFVIGAIFTPLARDPNFNWPNAEMASRGTLTACLISLGIAIPSGAGVALSILGNNTSSLVGVAISASLLPPAVNCGIFYAYAIFGPMFFDDLTPSASELAVSGSYSMLLTIVNILCIYTMGLVMFKIKEVAPIPGKTDFWKSAVRAQRMHHSGQTQRARDYHDTHTSGDIIRNTQDSKCDLADEHVSIHDNGSTLRQRPVPAGGPSFRGGILDLPLRSAAVGTGASVPDEVYGTNLGALMAFRPPAEDQEHLNMLHRHVSESMAQSEVNHGVVRRQLPQTYYPSVQDMWHPPRS